MKFRATFRDAKTLSNVCEILRGVHKKTIVKLSSTKLRFLVIPGGPLTSTEVGLHAWASLPTASIFNLFKIESNNDNDIYCEVTLKELASSVRGILGSGASSSTSTPITMKLTKLDGTLPVLSITSSLRVGTGDVTHCVPVRVLSDTEVKSTLTSPPALGGSVVSFWAPPLNILSKYLEGTKGSQVVQFTLDNSATSATTFISLKLTAHTASSIAQVTFPKLTRDVPKGTTGGDDEVRLPLVMNFDSKRLFALSGLSRSLPAMGAHRVLFHCLCGGGGDEGGSSCGLLVSVVCPEDVTFLYYLPSVSGDM
eukprot:PhF_6_TR13578/c0_g1_i1/m.21717/K10903/HUS1; HUS1 checkpoint protein